MIHLQDSRYAKVNQLANNEIDWSKMTDANSKEGKMASIDLMLLKFIEHHQLFEFIEIYKVYLKGDAEQQPENLGGKTFLHFAVEHSAD